MSEEAKEHKKMDDFVSLTYVETLAPNVQRFGDHLLAGTLVGHKCPSCGRVFVPGKGYCPMCVVETSDDDEVEVRDQGTVTGYTIITPVQYYGQQETQPFVVASVILDGADTALGMQDIVNIPHDQLRTGLRVKAVWRPEGERSVDGLSNRGWGGVAGVIDAFEPNGEPDDSLEKIREHMF